MKVDVVVVGNDDGDDGIGWLDGAWSYRVVRVSGE